MDRRLPELVDKRFVTSSDKHPVEVKDSLDTVPQLVAEDKLKGMHYKPVIVTAQQSYAG